MAGRRIVRGRRYSDLFLDAQPGGRGYDVLRDPVFGGIFSVRFYPPMSRVVRSGYPAHQHADARGGILASG